MHFALSQKLDNLQLMTSIQPSFETSPAQNSTAKTLIPSKTKRVDTKMSLMSEESTMETKTEYQKVPVTTSGGEVKLVSPSQAQANRAKANVRQEYKHCKVPPKTHTICGKGSSAKSKGKQSKGKTCKSKKKSASSKKQVSGKKKTSKKAKSKGKKAPSTKKVGGKKSGKGKTKGKK